MLLVLLLIYDMSIKLFRPKSQDVETEFGTTSLLTLRVYVPMI